MISSHRDSATEQSLGPRDAGFLLPWLSAFLAARRKGLRLLENVSRRMFAEVVAVNAAPNQSPSVCIQAVEQSRGNALLAGYRHTVNGFRLLHKMWLQKRHLQCALSGPTNKTVVWIALSTMRLPLPGEHSQRSRLRALLRALPGVTNEYEVANAIAHSDYILIFDPLRVSALWSSAQDCWKERVFLVDYTFIGYLLVSAPSAVIRELWRGRRYILMARNQLPRLARRMMWTASLLTAAYRRMLSNTVAMRAFFVTSNSFATEVLRVFLINTKECKEVCEVLHGVPSLEFQEYFDAVLNVYPDAIKHQFVPQIPGLPSYGVLHQSRNRTPGFAINAALNRYFLDRVEQGMRLAQWIKDQCACMPVQTNGTRRLIVVIMGATTYEKDYLQSKAFAVECALMRHIASVLGVRGEPFLLCYAPHPVHSLSLFTDLSFFAEHEIKVYRDTMFMWLVADLCVALYSSALFEAAFVGAKVFTPLRMTDEIYPEELLNLLHHPSDERTCMSALTEFLEKNNFMRNQSFDKRAEERAQRLAHFDAAAVSQGKLCETI